MSDRQAILGIIIATAALIAIFTLGSKADPSIDPTVDSSRAPMLGPDNAKIILEEYSDFECPSCQQSYPIIKQIMTDYDGKVQLIFHHFPLTNEHTHALLAAKAAEAAKAQGKFWAMHDLLFEHQSEWSSSPNPQAAFEQYAEDLGLDKTAFRTFLQQDRGLDQIKADQKEGEKRGVESTPTFFINGQGIAGVPQYELLKALFDKVLGE